MSDKSQKRYDVSVTLRLTFRVDSFSEEEARTHVKALLEGMAAKVYTPTCRVSKHFDFDVVEAGE
jgi:hypothetical protein